MRTLKLTHAEIDLLQRALGIAEMQFNSVRKTYLETLVNVRGVDSLTIVRQEADHMLQKENEFCDLLMSIKNGDKDV
jgi:hypothetical protein